MDEKTELKTPSSSARPQSRFTPGAILAERFRIVSLLGKGGMGEVYRAEDIKLGQQVALKFLPVADGAKLERLYREVRLGRQVSHPNVCRLYDVMEWEGQHFISMEYIDGEDLASLLRRIGRLPHDKALDIARDLCAGLTAAHSLGIIHRDLKPANIMIDGRGAARITDFGLAGVIDEPRHGEISGTPAYMAPEQLSGGEISARTDLYALGLILCEVFTGKRGLSSQDDLEPAIQRIILRCLEQRPEARPNSVQSVAASLPGGDPLQAAVDAGETPSPEMVAAAGEGGELRPPIAISMLAAFVVMLLLVAAIAQRVNLYGRVDFPKKPDVLAERARDIVAAAGYVQKPAGVAYTFGWNNQYFDSGRSEHDLNRVIPSPVVFYYRESPQDLLAWGSERRVTAVDPPLTVTGMANVELDATGRLIELAVVPPQVENASRQKPVDWSPFLAMTGIDVRTLRPTTPRWRAPVDSDQKAAWEGSGLRIEAASRNGRPVWFAVIPPWRQPNRTEFAGGLPTTRFGGVAQPIIGAATVLAAFYLARRNVRRARGDRQGAWRIAVFATTLTFWMRVLRVNHVFDPAPEAGILAQLLAEALLFGAVTFMVYLAIEPYFRRRFPRSLIGWNRLLAGRWRDPMVGRDVLIGAVAGAACAILLKLPFFYLPPIRTSFTALTEIRHLLYLMLFAVQLALGTGLATVFLFLLLRLITRNTTAASVLLIPILVVMMTVTGAGAELIGNAAIAILMVAVLRRYGVLALISLMVFFNIAVLAPLTLDPDVWYFARSAFAMLVAIAIAAYAFWVSLAAQPVLRLALEED